MRSEAHPHLQILKKWKLAPQKPAPVCPAPCAPKSLGRDPQAHSHARRQPSRCEGGPKKLGGGETTQKNPKKTHMPAIRQSSPMGVKPWARRAPAELPLNRKFLPKRTQEWPGLLDPPAPHPGGSRRANHHTRPRGWGLRTGPGSGQLPPAPSGPAAGRGRQRAAPRPGPAQPGLAFPGLALPGLARPGPAQPCPGRRGVTSARRFG